MQTQENAYVEDLSKYRWVLCLGYLYLGGFTLYLKA